MQVAAIEGGVDKPLIAAEPSWVAVRPDRELDWIFSTKIATCQRIAAVSYPKKEPTGVLAAETM
jgi:hypothetical protein